MNPEIVLALLSLFGFMLMPVWIIVLTMTLGALKDALLGPTR